MSKQEYLALAEQKYEQLLALQNKPTFYDYEKSFEDIWQELGRQVLEKSLGELPADRRKKKLMSRYGKIHIANSQPFSNHPHGFGVTPYLQEKLVLLGQSETYTQAAHLARQLLNLPVGSSQLYRLTTHYGQAIETDLDQPLACQPDKEGLVYVEVDGAMLLTEEGYKENKLGRVFEADALCSSPLEGRGGHITHSLYAAHLGPAADFTAKLTPHLDQLQAQGRALVFLSDGAVWLRHWMSSRYPKARLILDFAHAMGYVGQAGVAAFGEGKLGQEWIERESKLLLNSELDAVLAHIRALKITPALREKVVGYLADNRPRMDYKYYRAQGWLIGSGAIESAHRSVVQHRLKRAGQRWSIRGAQRVLNLRVCASSDRWHLVRRHIEPQQTPLAA